PTRRSSDLKLSDELIGVTVGMAGVVRRGAGDLIEAKQKVLDALQRVLRVYERLVAEIQLGAMGNRQQRVSKHQRRIAHLLDFLQRVDVAERLGHLLLFDIEMLAVDPETDERLAGRAFALCDFVFVMRKNQ